MLASVLQALTVCAYGPIWGYLSEHFPTEVRSTEYGMGYSMSLVLLAHFCIYLPWLESALGQQGAVMVLIVSGRGLMVAGALRGPKLGLNEIRADIDNASGTIDDAVTERTP